MTILCNIEDNFRGMVSSGDVDVSVNALLIKLRDDLLSFKESFLKRKNLLDLFSVFHAVETQLRIIDQMILRVRNARAAGDNPKVADDALMVLPQMRFVNDSLKDFKKLESRYVLGLSSDLQVVAMKNGMYPPHDKVTKAVSKRQLKKGLSRFVSNVGEELERS